MDGIGSGRQGNRKTKMTNHKYESQGHFYHYLKLLITSFTAQKKEDIYDLPLLIMAMTYKGTKVSTDGTQARDLDLFLMV